MFLCFVGTFNMVAIYFNREKEISKNIKTEKNQINEDKYRKNIIFVSTRIKHFN